MSSRISSPCGTTALTVEPGENGSHWSQPYHCHTSSEETSRLGPEAPLPQQVPMTAPPFWSIAPPLPAVSGHAGVIGTGLTRPGVSGGGGVSCANAGAVSATRSAVVAANAATKRAEDLGWSVQC